MPPGVRSMSALANGREIEARSVVLATGYVMPDIVRSTVHAVSSSWAIATVPQPQNIWNDGALIWEDAEDYLYARTTRAGRIIIGGEDSDGDYRTRGARSPDPREIARAGAAGSRHSGRPRHPISNSAGRGRSIRRSDGLPLIGPVPGAKGVYAAYGYGGNGITFSFLAARLIGDLIAGKTSPLLRRFRDRIATAAETWLAAEKWLVEMARLGLETSVSRTRCTRDAIFPTHDHPDRIRRRGGRGCHADRHPSWHRPRPQENP